MSAYFKNDDNVWKQILSWRSHDTVKLSKRWKMSRLYTASLQKQSDIWEIISFVSKALKNSLIIFECSQDAVFKACRLVFRFQIYGFRNLRAKYGLFSCDCRTIRHIFHLLQNVTLLCERSLSEKQRNLDASCLILQ